MHNMDAGYFHTLLPLPVPPCSSAVLLQTILHRFEHYCCHSLSDRITAAYVRGVWGHVMHA
jgi:hypothetical protein